MNVFDSIPQEIFFHICGGLDGISLTRCLRVCKEWKKRLDTVSAVRLWRRSLDEEIIHLQKQCSDQHHVTGEEKEEEDEDQDIETDRKIIYDEEGELIAFETNALIDHIFSPQYWKECEVETSQNASKNPSYRLSIFLEKIHEPVHRIFLMCYDSLLSTDDLIQKILIRLITGIDNKDTFAIKCSLHLLSDWMQSHNSVTETILNALLGALIFIRYLQRTKYLNETSDEVATTHLPSLTLIIDNFTNSLLQFRQITLDESKKMSLVDHLKRFGVFAGQASEDKNSSKIDVSELNVLDIDPEDLALMLSIHEWNTLSLIKVHQNISFPVLCELELLILRMFQKHEFVLRSWNNTDPNIGPSAQTTKCIFQFDKLSNWIIWSILSASELSTRKKILRKCLQIASELFKLNNHSSLFSVFYGLNNSAIIRLDKTWEAKDRKAWRRFDNICNHRSPSPLMSIVNDMKPGQPRNLYLGFNFTHLIFILDGNERKINGLHNFTRLRTTSGIISRFYSQHFDHGRYTSKQSNYIRKKKDKGVNHPIILAQLVDSIMNTQYENQEKASQRSLELEP